MKLLRYGVPRDGLANSNVCIPLRVILSQYYLSKNYRIMLLSVDHGVITQLDSGTL